MNEQARRLWKRAADAEFEAQELEKIGQTDEAMRARKRMARLREAAINEGLYSDLTERPEPFS